MATSAVQGTGRSAVSHSREFGDLIKSVGECRSKQEEDRIMSQEVSTLKAVFRSPNLDKAKMREYLLRLVYVEMLGHDASFAYIHVVNACSDKNWILKKVGYLATTLFLNEESEYIIMLVNTIMKDLQDDNHLVVCTALHALCKLIHNDTISGFMPLVLKALSHPKELVKKKAVMVLHRFLQIRPSLREELDKPLRKMLCDNDPSVMSAALCALHEVIRESPGPYKNLVPSFVSILKQVAEHRLPKAYDYHKTPAPFIQIKLLKILAKLGEGDKAASEHIYSVLSDVMRRANSGHTIGNAVVYEAVRTVTAIYPNAVLLQSAAEMVSTFLRSSSHNLKYIGVDSLSAVVAINPKYVQEQQMVVIDCLEDPDESLKRKTLELLYKMTKPNNVEVIVERMLNYLSTATDPHSKAETSSRIAELAERYAPDNDWFIEVMNSVFKMGGDCVDPSLGNNIMRIVAEGAGDDSDEADARLRSNAVLSFLDLLELPKLSDVLLKVIFWVLGEYGGDYTPHGAAAAITKLLGVLDQQTVSDSARGYLLSALGKLCCQTGASLTRDAEAFLRAAASSRNADLQQRALEIQSLLSCDPATQAAALPHDAASEDIEVDPRLRFLDGYVEKALQAGAAAYIPQEVRDSLGVVRDSHDAAPSPGIGGLRFEAYEKATPAAPLHAEAAPEASQPLASPPVADPRAAAAVGAPARPSAGPQLRVSGPRKWGPAQFESNSAPAAARAPAQDVPASPPRGGQAPESPAQAAAAQSPAEPADDRAKLASALFGGSSPTRHKPRRVPPKSPAKARTEAPVPAPDPPPAQDLLLDLDDPAPEDSGKPAPAASPIDLLSELADLSVGPDAGVPPPVPSTQPTMPAGGGPAGWGMPAGHPHAAPLDGGVLGGIPQSHYAGMPQPPTGVMMAPQQMALGPGVMGFPQGAMGMAPPGWGGAAMPIPQPSSSGAPVVQQGISKEGSGQSRPKLGEKQASNDPFADLI